LGRDEALTLLGLCWHILRNSDARTTELRAAIKIRAALPVFVIAVVSSPV